MRESLMQVTCNNTFRDGLGKKGYPRQACKYIKYVSRANEPDYPAMHSANVQFAGRSAMAMPATRLGITTSARFFIPCPLFAL